MLSTNFSETSSARNSVSVNDVSRPSFRNDQLSCSLRYRITRCVLRSDPQSFREFVKPPEECLGQYPGRRPDCAQPEAHNGKGNHRVRRPNVQDLLPSRCSYLREILSWYRRSIQIKTQMHRGRIVLPVVVFLTTWTVRFLSKK